jgi:hypothetical protein
MLNKIIITAIIPAKFFFITILPLGLLDKGGHGLYIFSP